MVSGSFQVFENVKSTTVCEGFLSCGSIESDVLRKTVPSATCTYRYLGSVDGHAK